jgi:hypothetical protein
MQKVDRIYEREVRMGAVPIPPLDPIRQGKSHLPQTPVFIGTAAPKRAVWYSWLPMSEIHTARTRIDSFVHLIPSQQKKFHEEFASMVSYLIRQFDIIGDLDDESITADQATVLTQVFSVALIEIQKNLVLANRAAVHPQSARACVESAPENIIGGSSAVSRKYAESVRHRRNSEKAGVANPEKGARLHH